MLCDIEEVPGRGGGGGLSEHTLSSPSLSISTLGYSTKGFSIRLNTFFLLMFIAWPCKCFVDCPVQMTAMWVGGIRGGGVGVRGSTGSPGLPGRRVFQFLRKTCSQDSRYDKMYNPDADWAN